ncbi:phosphonate C-P lyase system protein PhnG [Marinomonas sp. RSW2]|uniref:Phosphonate C-P lyase system protein PhnG n=1 Tax=Marinomonas maritima TaxID=2940935 RepID=A0ABT5WBG0_9GAMM|nr:phosphonate C-P lyase system protein PhnG [Marinomonas maritima]MDE8602158.1 phosphonate C-P lyase system protein PhnG [Marinomonas maritima]
MISKPMSDTQKTRQHWMSVMAKSNSDSLIKLSNVYMDQQDFENIRPAEVGLTQIRGRMGGTGSQFNVGDMTITRCVVQSAKGHYGHSYIAGRDKNHALRAAQLDAMLQDPTHQHSLMENIIQPLAHTLATQQAQKANNVAQTKVNFFTLVRGED